MKQLEWMGDSLENLKKFPEDVSKSIGFALHSVQCGEVPLSAKPHEGPGRGF